MLAVVLLPALSYASGSTQLATSASEFSNWVPIIAIAMILSLALISGYYMIGVALNNARVKGQAISEFYQILGTMVLLVILLFILGVFGTTLTSTSTIVSPSSIQTLCNNLQNSVYQFTNSSYSYADIPSPTKAVCDQLIGTESKQTSGSGSGQVSASGQTANLDYGLAAVYVIDANVTNQTVRNLNALYLFDLEYGWLRTFKSSTVLCLPGGVPGCALPTTPRPFYIEYSYSPFGAYVLERSIMPTVEITATLTFYLQLLTMIIILLFLYAWPFVLAGGIILRTFFLTRRAGGFLIALVVVLLIVYPVVYLMEYSALSAPLCHYGTSQNPGVTGGQTPVVAGSTGTNGKNCVELIGTDSLPSLQINELPLSDTFYTASKFDGDLGTSNPLPNPPVTRAYQLSFFNLPDLAEAFNFYGCYPSSLLKTEMEFASNYLIPGVGLVEGSGSGLSVTSNPIQLIQEIFGAFSSLGGNAPASFALPGVIPANIHAYYCFTPEGMANASITAINIYGLMSVTTFILPLFNVLIMLSGILGLSGLLGGDTNIVGLGRFI